MSATIIDLKSRRVLAPPPPNPFAAALAGFASAQAALYGAPYRYWSDICALYSGQRADGDCRPPDSEPAA